MIKSMTGYGRAGLTISEGAESFIIEIKTVNHRYLDINCRLNDRFFSLEPFIKEEVKKRFSRGAFTVLAYSDQSAPPCLKLNTAVAKAYVDAADALKNSLGIRGELDIEGLLRLKDVFSAPVGKNIDASLLKDALKDCLVSVFNELESWREREGASLGIDVKNRIKSLEALLGAVELRAPEIHTAYREKLRLEMEKILKDRVDENRILAEAAIYAEKCDTSEEITRLKSHFRLFHEYLDGGGPVGKKLDFLCQELFREINTIGSKAGDAGTTRTIVDMKAELEKIREQVQNIE